MIDIPRCHDRSWNARKGLAGSGRPFSFCGTLEGSPDFSPWHFAPGIITSLTVIDKPSSIAWRVLFDSLISCSSSQMDQVFRNAGFPLPMSGHALSVRAQASQVHEKTRNLSLPYLFSAQVHNWIEFCETLILLCQYQAMPRRFEAKLR